MKRTLRATALGALLPFMLGAAPSPDAGTRRPPTTPKKAPQAADAGIAEIVPFRWDVPKLMYEIEVPDGFLTNGIPNRFHVAVSSWDQAALYSHFHNLFVRSGFHIPPAERQLKLGQGQVMLTGFDPETETSYSVILIPQPGGGTQVVMGEAYFKDQRFGPKADFAPVYPGARAMMTTTAEGSNSLTYAVTAPAAEVMKFYKEELTRAGFEPQADGTFLRGSEVIHVIATQSSTSAETHVALTRMRGPEQVSPTP